MEPKLYEEGIEEKTKVKPYLQLGQDTCTTRKLSA